MVGVSRWLVWLAAKMTGDERLSRTSPPVTCMGAMRSSRPKVAVWATWRTAAATPDSGHVGNGVAVDSCSLAICMAFSLRGLLHVSLGGNNKQTRLYTPRLVE